MEPSAILSAWGAGIAAGTALVGRWAVVGPGFAWLGFGVTFLLAAPGAVAGAGVAAWIGGGLAVVGVAAARSRSWSPIAGLGASAALVVAGSGGSRILLVVTGAAALGGVTVEMLLGHWYLVDPRLPRWALRSLCLAALCGVMADIAALLALGAIPWSPADAVVGYGWVLLGVTGPLLMAAVWFALGERGYPAVMAATGLSYLAVLTTIGAVVLGRVLVTA